MPRREIISTNTARRVLDTAREVLHAEECESSAIDLQLLGGPGQMMNSLDTADS